MSLNRTSIDVTLKVWDMRTEENFICFLHLKFGCAVEAFGFAVTLLSTEAHCEKSSVEVCYMRKRYAP